MLVEIGYKEIEVAFPCASDTEWKFTRHLVENPELVPDDVWLQVLTPSKPDLIVHTIEAIRGAKRATIQFYIASSQQFQDLVLGMSEDESVALVVDCARIIRSLTKDYDSKANKGTLGVSNSV
jgi:2-isopropylmalate synthase